MLTRLILVFVLLVANTSIAAQALYKYRGPDGEWMFSDRPPRDQQEVEVRKLEIGTPDPVVDVYHRIVGEQIQLFARNDYHAPVEIVLGLDQLRSVSLPPPDQSLQFVVEPQSETLLITFAVLDEPLSPMVAYNYRYLPGDPRSSHSPDTPYRAPFAVANDYPISQAYPHSITHAAPDAYFAVDIAMPIGTDIYAARRGTVFDVARTNFRGGIDLDTDIADANLIRILHDDGTYGVYAHLNWNTIRVKPGDIVERGEYIADSGNTGFSSGPHLHFAVIRNTGMRSESVPFVFAGPNSTEVTPEMGVGLTAY